jgi:hypothetical protein
LPPDPSFLEKHGVSALHTKLLGLTVVIPISLVYLGALYGFVRVQDYAIKVGNTKEGPHFRNLAIGLMILAFSLPVRSIIGSVGNYWKHAQPHLFSDISIFRNYVTVILSLLAIYYIAKGARGLYGTLKRQTLDYNNIYVLIGTIMLASVYTWLVVSQGLSDPRNNTFFLPMWLVIFTITIPYVLSWCIGAWAVAQLYKYEKGVKGTVYKRAIDLIAKGIAVIILISILLQLLGSLTGMLNRLDLTPLLLVIYVLVAFYVVGYGLVARGAKKLKQIEEA